MTGFADGEGGIARPSLGARFALCCRLPGIGGRRRGAGEDIPKGLLLSGIWSLDVSFTPLHHQHNKVGGEGSSILVEGYIWQ